MEFKKNVKKTKEELKVVAEKIAVLINEADLKGEIPFIDVISGDKEEVVKESVPARTVLDDVISEYATISRTDCFNALKDTDDPMLEAIKVFNYDVIRAVEKKVGEGDVKTSVLEITDGVRQIDLRALHKFIDGGIGKNKSWIYMIQQFNKLMTARVINDLSGTAKEKSAKLKKLNDSYAMDKIARDIDLGKDVVSNTAMLNALQSIITAMIGDEYKALTHDVKFLLYTYCRKDRAALKVNCANHKYLTSYVMSIANRIVTGGVYEEGYKAVKSKS